MPSKPPYPHSTRLENLSLDPQGAAFDLEGRPIRLPAEGYAGPVASMQEFYHHALADYYQRSAELSRQSAPRPPLLSRVISWVGRVFARLIPGSRPAPAFLPAPPPPPAPGARETAAPAPRRGTEPGPAIRETALMAAVPPSLIGPRGHPSPAAMGAALTSREPGGPAKAEAAHRGAKPPILHVVFADQDGVHVIWQFASAQREAKAKGGDPTDPKGSPPRLELTYSLDSSMAQRLQDCYGQLAQLGYKITGLEAVRASPEKPTAEKDAAKSAPIPVASTAKVEPVEKLAEAALPPAESQVTPRKPRPKPEASPTRTDPAKALPPEPPNPSFLPGI